MLYIKSKIEVNILNILWQLKELFHIYSSQSLFDLRRKKNIYSIELRLYV